VIVFLVSPILGLHWHGHRGLRPEQSPVRPIAADWEVKAGNSTQDSVRADMGGVEPFGISDG
jgi:hypothetical protein